MSTKEARALAEFGRDRYAESFKASFGVLCERAGWPSEVNRRLLRFFKSESTPEYWATLPDIEAQGQLYQWLLLEHKDAPVERWGDLPLAEQLAAALAWVDTEKSNGADDTRRGAADREADQPAAGPDADTARRSARYG